MTIGIALTKGQLDTDVGAAALELVKLLRVIDQLQELFLIHADADFTALGYTAGEVATMKSAWLTDAPQLAQIVRGLAALPVAKDFRANIDLMMGDGLA